MTKEELVLGLIDLGIVSEESKDSFVELDETILKELHTNASKKALSSRDVAALIKDKKIDDAIKVTLSNNVEDRRRAVQEKNDYKNKVKTVIEELQKLL